MADAIYLAGFDPCNDVCIALDCASSQFYSDGYYKIFNEFMKIGVVGNY
ncbi:hypothetical protein [Candidatus Ichthyocystis sparus]|nr:hypothetical protein [Candidatus Ichthyocystis sparus]